MESVTHTVVYTYNGDGVRVAQAVSRSGSTTVTEWVQTLASHCTSYNRLSNSGCELPQVLVESTGSEITIYTCGIERLAQVKADGTEWFLGDALGSVRQVVDDSGGVILSRDYDPYGQIVAESGDGSSGYGFTGEQYNASTELLFLRARYYGLGTGRFLSHDPWKGSIHRPRTLHKYVYVADNPINFADPSGLVSESEKFYIRLLYRRHIKDAASRLNARSLTNLSDDAFAAMIAAKMLMEDATVYADQQPDGTMRQISTLPFTEFRDWSRDLAEQHIFGGEISWGPANIPLQLATQNLEWWEQNYSSFDFDFQDLPTYYYDARNRNWLGRWMFGSEQRQLAFELQTNKGAVNQMALAILRSSHRAKAYWDRQVCPPPPRDLSAYVIAMGVIHFRENDATLYDLNNWRSKGSQWNWTEAIDDAGNVLGLNLAVPRDYIPYAQEEKQKLDTLDEG
jgi:RHS repeat-associated protein